jgi:hypothetical protein
MSLQKPSWLFSLKFLLLGYIMKRNYTNILLAAALILLAAVSRIINQEAGLYHLAPVAALGLFSGAVVKDKRLAFLFTLLAQLISDTYIAMFTNMQGFYGISQLFTYAGMMLVTLLGTKMGQPKALKVAGYSIAGSALFFIVSNLGVYAHGFYGYDVNGLLTTYMMALPFYTSFGTELFINSFVGDLVFSGILFGAYHMLQTSLHAKAQKAKA